MSADESTQTGKFESFGRKVDEHVSGAMPKVEEELKKVIAYLNDEVVPEVRQNSSRALRSAAEQLARMADSLDNRGGTR